MDRHFTEDELRTSDRYHRPLRRAGLLALVAKATLLFVAVPAAASLSAGLADGGFDEGWHRDRGWLGAMSATRVMLGATLVVAAVRVPATIADAWFEFRFRRGDPDYVPVHVAWFLATSAALGLGSIAGLTVISGLLYHVAGTRTDWPLVLGALTLAVLAGAAFWEHLVRRLLPSGETLVEPASDLMAELQAVAARFELAGLQFGTRSGGAYGDASVEQAANAYTAGIGGHRRVIMTDALLDLDSRTRDFVVAHELVHVRRRHVLVQSGVGAVTPIIAIAILAVLADGVRPWSWIGLEPFDPAGLAVPVLLVGAVSAAVGPCLSWLSRAHERSADAGAIAAMGPLSTPLAKQMYLAATVDLDPPWWARLYGGHPTPAERLEFLVRATPEEGLPGVRLQSETR